MGLSNTHRDQFLQRGISETVLRRNGVYSDGEDICFPVRRGGETINVKRRSPNKSFQQTKGAPQVLFGVDDIQQTCTIICEGEPDKFALEEAGFVNSVSVPAGANSRVDCLDPLLAVEKVVIAVDNDGPGNELKKRILDRLGYWRCLETEYPSGCKDANDVLMHHGKAALKSVIDSASPCPVPYVQRVPIDISTNSPPPPRQVLPGVVPCASTLFVAPGHTGKSVELIRLAINVALGRKMFGRDCRAGKVLYCHGEDSSDDVLRLIHKLTRHANLGGFECSLLRENLLPLAAHVVPDFRLLRDEGAAFVRGRAFEIIEEIVGSGSFRLVICDTLSSLGLPETAGMNDGAAAYHLAANGIAEKYDVAFIGAHHVGQDKSECRSIGMYSARGATALADNARCVIQLQRHNSEKDRRHVAPAPIDTSFVARWHVVKHKWSILTGETPLWAYSYDYDVQDYDAIAVPDIGEARSRAEREAAMAKRSLEFSETLELVKRALGPTKNEVTVEEVYACGSIPIGRLRTTLNAMADRRELARRRNKKDGEKGASRYYFSLPAGTACEE